MLAANVFQIAPLMFTPLLVKGIEQIVPIFLTPVLLYHSNMGGALR